MNLQWYKQVESFLCVNAVDLLCVKYIALRGVGGGARAEQVWTISVRNKYTNKR